MLKKVLDKCGKGWYNILVGNGSKMSEEEFTVSLETKKLGLEILKAVDEAAQKAASRFDVPPVLIAGGAVRDVYFGIVPKDVDIFVDVSGSHEDQVDDLFVLLGTDIIQTLQEGRRFFPENHRVSKLATEEVEDYNGLSAVKGGEQYTIYQTDYMPFEDQLLPRMQQAPQEEDEDEPVDVFDNREMFNIQLISRCTPLLHQDKPSFVQSFDYPFVKCYWDGGLVLSEDFLSTLRTKSLSVPNGEWGTPAQRTYERVENFWYKWRGALGRAGKDLDSPITFDFQKVKRKKGTTTYGTIKDAPWKRDDFQAFFGDPLAGFERIDGVNVGGNAAW